MEQVQQHNVWGLQDVDNWGLKILDSVRVLEPQLLRNVYGLYDWVTILMPLLNILFKSSTVKTDWKWLFNAVVLSFASVTCCMVIDFERWYRGHSPFHGPNIDISRIDVAVQRTLYQEYGNNNFHRLFSAFC